MIQGETHTTIVCHQKCFVWYYVPKAASTSMKHWLGPYVIKDFAQKMEDSGGRIHEIYNKVEKTAQGGSQNKKYFHFAFVRDPVERCVSYYKRMIIDVKRRGLTPRLDPYNITRFDQFIAGLEEYTHKDTHHLTAQLNFLPSVSQLDLLANVRDLDVFAPELAERFDLPPFPSDKKNVSPADIHVEVTTEHINKIKDVYHRDYASLSEIFAGAHMRRGKIQNVN